MKNQVSNDFPDWLLTLLSEAVFKDNRSKYRFIYEAYVFITENCPIKKRRYEYKLIETTIPVELIDVFNVVDFESLGQSINNTNRIKLQIEKAVKKLSMVNYGQQSNSNRK